MRAQLARAQGGDGLLVARVHCEEEAAQAAHRQHASLRQGLPRAAQRVSGQGAAAGVVFDVQREIVIR